VGAAALVAALSGCWLQPGLGPERNAWNSLEDTLTADTVGRLEQAWAVDLGTAAVNDPVVSEVGVHATSNQVITTVRRDDGSRRWSVPLDGHEVYGATKHEDTLIVAGTGGWRLNVETGEGPAAPPGYIRTSVAIVGNGYWVGEHFERCCDGQSFHTMGVRDLDDPSQNWTMFLGTGEGFRRDDFAIGSERFYRGNAAYSFSKPDRPCDAFDPPLCEPLWRAPLLPNGGAPSRPVLSPDDQTLYFAQTGGALTAVDAVDGTLLWRTDVGGGGARQLLAPPTVDDGSLYLPASDGTVYRLPAAGCGAPTCTATVLGVAGREVTKQAALAGGVLYVAAGDGTVEAFPAGGCTQPPCAALWSVDTGASPITGAPAVAFGSLVVGTGDGRVIAYRVREG
jgi:outer membrane protein assembly factor BamB